MKKLPMPTRRRIYRETIEYIESTLVYSHYTCHLLAIKYSKKTGTDVNGIYPEHVFELFPEFAKQKPKRKQIGDIWWRLGYKGNRVRIKALERAIDLCNKK